MKLETLFFARLSMSQSLSKFLFFFAFFSELSLVLISFKILTLNHLVDFCVLLVFVVNIKAQSQGAVFKDSTNASLSWFLMSV